VRIVLGIGTTLLVGSIAVEDFVALLGGQPEDDGAYWADVGADAALLAEADVQGRPAVDQPHDLGRAGLDAGLTTVTLENIDDRDHFSLLS
jgi:hypothetical protein